MARWFVVAFYFWRTSLLSIPDRAEYPDTAAYSGAVTASLLMPFFWLALVAWIWRAVTSSDEPRSLRFMMSRLPVLLVTLALLLAFNSQR